MRWLPLLLTFTLAGCVSPVIIDHRADTNFSRYHSYALASSSGDAEPLSLDGQRVQAALRAALAAIELQPATTTKAADLLVRYQFKPVEHFRGTTMQFGFGVWHHGVGLSTETPVEGTTVQEHQLQVILIDTDNQRVIWQATSRDTLRPSLTGEQRNARIQEMVREMFKRYPPQNTGQATATELSHSTS